MQYENPDSNLKAAIKALGEISVFMWVGHRLRIIKKYKIN
jgi:hypothetical protein